MSKRPFFTNLIEEFDSSITTPADALSLLDLAVEEATRRLAGTASEDLIPTIKAELRDEFRERYGV